MSEWKYFRREEFACKHTGENKIKDRFITRLDELRELCGFPFVITSGYRSPEHPEEASKPNGPGTHSKGIAADIKVTNGVERRIIIDAALEMEFHGIGVAKGFVHVDDRTDTPVIWTY